MHLKTTLVAIALAAALSAPAVAAQSKPKPSWATYSFHVSPGASETLTSATRFRADTPWSAHVDGYQGVFAEFDGPYAVWAYKRGVIIHVAFTKGRGPVEIKVTNTSPHARFVRVTLRR